MGGRGRAWAVAWTAAAWVFLGACHDRQELERVRATAMLDSPLLEFGEVPVGEWRTQSIMLRNTGYVAFQVNEVAPEVGNPAFILELEPGMLRPGEARPITVRFHPVTEGVQEETTPILTNADDVPLDRLLVRGSGGPPRVEFLPGTLDFETLEVDSRRSLRAELVNHSDLPLEVQLPAGAPYSASATDIPPLSTFPLEVTYRPVAVGEYPSAVEFRACTGCTPARLAVRGRAVPFAFVFDPTPLPFPDVPVHQSANATARATNITWRPVAVDRLVPSDGAFAALTDLSGVTFQPGETRALEVSFSARSAGPSQGELAVHYVSDRARVAPLPLDARGGRPALALSPAALDFGEVPVGGQGAAVVWLTNAGTTGNLLVQGVRALGPGVAAFSVSRPYRGDAPNPPEVPWAAGTAWPTLQLQPAEAVAPGVDALRLRFAFAPDKEGPFAAEVRVQSDDLFFPERVLTLTGRGRASGPCVYTVTPSGVDFGLVPLGTGAVLGFHFANAGPAECAVKDIRVTSDAGGAFFMPGGPIPGGTVPTASAFSSQVAFRPRASGEAAGELTFTVNSPTAPQVRIALKGRAGESCLAAVPNFLDFGPVRLDCQPVPRRGRILNTCPRPVTVSRLWLGVGTSEQFQLAVAPPMPRVLGPGEGFELQVEYARNVRGQHTTPLFAQADGEPGPLLVPLLGETNLPGSNVERFTQGNPDQLDLLFVVSNSSTAASQQARLRAAAPGLFQEARARGLDLQVGVTSTGLVPAGPACPGGAEGGEAGRLVPVDGSRPRIIPGAAADAATLLAQAFQLGTCHALVQPLEAMRSALSAPLATSADDPRTAAPADGNLGLLRPGARLAVVLVADEDDHSGADAETYVQFLQALKGPGMGHRVSAWSLAPLGAACRTAGPPGPRLRAVAERTGGLAGDVCDGSYAGLLSTLLSTATGLQRTFHLSQAPGDPAALAVTAGGRAVPPGEWRYDAAQQAVVLTSASAPAVGEQLTVSYQAVCPPPP